jgi:hypothetical protein
MLATVAVSFIKCIAQSAMFLVLPEDGDRARLRNVVIPANSDTIPFSANFRTVILAFVFMAANCIITLKEEQKLKAFETNCGENFSV